VLPRFWLNYNESIAGPGWRSHQGSPSPARQTHSRGSRRSVAREDSVEVLAGADAELGEDLAQVVLDRLAADEQLGGDLLVGCPVACRLATNSIASSQAAPRDPAGLAGLAGSRGPWAVCGRLRAREKSD